MTFVDWCCLISGAVATLFLAAACWEWGAKW